MPFVFSQKLHAVIIIYTMMSITWNFTCCIITKISAIPTVYTLSCVNKYLRRYLGLDFFLIKKINNSMYLFIHSFFIWPHLQHMEVPGLRVKSELQLPAYATATATPDPSHICDLYCSLQQCQILNSLREARNCICILMDTILRSHMGSPDLFF